MVDTDKNLECISITDKVVNYINDAKIDRKNQGAFYTELTAKDIALALDIDNRFPAICNGMKKAMNSDDEILYEPKSGQSPMVKIRYKIQR